MQRRDLYIWLGILVLDLVVVFVNQNTFDGGDSILHYLHSKQAFSYPKHFLGHWSKPVFVLLSAPVTQLGWWGMKLFNALCIFGSSILCWQLFRDFGLRSWVAPLFCFAAPAFVLVQSSGLTEPLFTLMMMGVILLLHRKRWMGGLILLSFLPFARSEGWIVMIICAVYVIQERSFKWLPLLASGTVLYALVALVVHGDLLWFLHQHSYLGVEEKYGSGQALHFVDQLLYIIGLPLYILVFLGLYDGYWRVIRGQMAYSEFFLIYGIFIGYITAHSIFWAQGWFHSLGISRVLIVLVPLAAFIAYRGMERLQCALGFIRARTIRWAVVGLVAVFPFTANNAALGLPESFKQEPAQSLMDEVAAYCRDSMGPARIYYGSDYFPMSMGVDIDDPDQALKIGLLNEFQAEAQSIVLWDSYSAVTDQQVYTKDLRERSDLVFVRRFNCEDCERSFMVDLYRSKEWE